jgi:hypothetical protein
VRLLGASKATFIVRASEGKADILYRQSGFCILDGFFVERAVISVAGSRSGFSPSISKPARMPSGCSQLGCAGSIGPWPIGSTAHDTESAATWAERYPDFRRELLAAAIRE